MSGDRYFQLIALNLILIWTLKVVVFVVGYLVVRMGVNLLQQGVRGEFKFQGTLQGAKADLRSSSPGIFFTFLGIVLIVAALLIKTTTPFRQTIENTLGVSTELNSAPPIPGKDPFAPREKEGER